MSGTWTGIGELLLADPVRIHWGRGLEPGEASRGNPCPIIEQRLEVGDIACVCATIGGAFAGLAPIETNLTLRELQRADELFMTNAVFGIWPIAKLDEQRYPCGPATRRLMELLGIGRDA